MAKRRSTKQKQRHHARAKKYSRFHNFYVNMEDNDRWKLSWHESNIYDLEEEERRRLEEDESSDWYWYELSEDEEECHRLEEERQHNSWGLRRGECNCMWVKHTNPYFCDDNWGQREHDSWESLRDKD